jgi:hypothetical protein
LDADLGEKSERGFEIFGLGEPEQRRKRAADFGGFLACEPEVLEQEVEHRPHAGVHVEAEEEREGVHGARQVRDRVQAQLAHQEVEPRRQLRRHVEFEHLREGPHHRARLEAAPRQVLRGGPQHGVGVAQQPRRRPQHAAHLGVGEAHEGRREERRNAGHRGRGHEQQRRPAEGGEHERFAREPDRRERLGRGHHARRVGREEAGLAAAQAAHVVPTKRATKQQMKPL